MTNNHPEQSRALFIAKIGKGLTRAGDCVAKIGTGRTSQRVAWQGGSCAHALKFSPADAMQTHAWHHAGEDGGKREAFSHRRVQNRLSADCNPWQQGAKVFGEAGSGPS